VNTATVGIIDYEAGNIASMRSALQHLGAQVQVIKSQSDARELTHVVLPGVGAFGYCRQQLQESGLIPFLETWTLTLGKPLLGICVGLQLLTRSSEESQADPGLGWIPARTQRLQPSRSSERIPHVGWDDLEFSASFKYPHKGPRDYYFDHSYAVLDPPAGASIATCDFGGGFVAAIRSGNIFATQFHPEKSQRSGLDFLSYFLSSC